MVLEIMAFSNDGCTIVSGQMSVRAFKRWGWKMTVRWTGPRVTTKKKPECPCGLECVQGDAFGVWTFKEFMVPVYYTLTSSLDVGGQ
jgi:hypothetical protein